MILPQGHPTIKCLLLLEWFSVCFKKKRAGRITDISVNLVPNLVHVAKERMHILIIIYIYIIWLIKEVLITFIILRVWQEQHTSKNTVTSSEQDLIIKPGFYHPMLWNKWTDFSVTVSHFIKIFVCPSEREHFWSALWLPQKINSPWPGL